MGQGLRHAVMTHIEAYQCQVSAICVQVVETLLVEVAAECLTLWSIHRTSLAQGVLQFAQGRQDVLTKRLTDTGTHRQHKHHTKGQELICAYKQVLKTLCLYVIQSSLTLYNIKLIVVVLLSKAQYDKVEPLPEPRILNGSRTGNSQVIPSHRNHTYANLIVFSRCDQTIRVRFLRCHVPEMGGQVLHILYDSTLLLLCLKC